MLRTSDRQQQLAALQQPISWWRSDACRSLRGREGHPKNAASNRDGRAPFYRRLMAVLRLAYDLMDIEFVEKFVGEWEAGWNSHDVDRLLVHYTDDVVFQSPYVVHRFDDPVGEVRGKEVLRSYWSSGLSLQPDLHVIVDDIRLSVDTLVINYRN